MNVLCIGDSLGMPREGCPEEDVWISLLRQKYPESVFIGEFKRARLTADALECYRQQYSNNKADITILQLGIVDCSPRYINTLNVIVRLTHYCFNKVGKEELFWRIVKLRPRSQKCVYSSPSRFKKIYTCLIKEILDCGGNIIVIKIGHGANSILKSSKYFNANVDKYNDILDEIVSQYKGCVFSINPLDKVDEEDFVDGYHCSSKGMRMVYEELTTVIDSISVK